MTENDSKIPAQGMLAREAGKCFPLEVCKSHAGFYIGTRNEEGFPYSHESKEYWRKQEQATDALARGKWTQKPHP